MPDSDDRPNDAGMAAAVEELADEIADDMATPGAQPVLAGDATVTISFTVHDASTPQEATDMAILTMAQVGFNAFFFQVHDQESDAIYHVRAGELVNLTDETGGS